MSDEIPPLANRRPSPRKRSFLGCTVVYAEGAHSFPCVIRDITPQGARIGFDSGTTLPSSFWLVSTRDRTAHKARAAWVTSTEAGVEFENNIPLHQLPADLSWLKRFAGGQGSWM